MSVESACSGKIRYVSPLEAHRKLKRKTAQKRRSKSYNSAKVYRCPHCAGYHLAHRESY